MQIQFREWILFKWFLPQDTSSFWANMWNSISIEFIHMAEISQKGMLTLIGFEGIQRQSWLIFIQTKKLL